jgi:hypothetical protein
LFDEDNVAYEILEKPMRHDIGLYKDLISLSNELRKRKLLGIACLSVKQNSFSVKLLRALGGCLGTGRR